MAIEKVSKFTLLALQKDKVSILNTLHELGVCHLTTKESYKVKELDQDHGIDSLPQISDNLLYLQWLKEQMLQFSIPFDFKPFSNTSLQQSLTKAKHLKSNTYKAVFQSVEKLKQYENLLRLESERYEKLIEYPFKTISFSNQEILTYIAITSTELFLEKHIKKITKTSEIISNEHANLIILPKVHEKEVVEYLRKIDAEILDKPHVATTVNAELAQIPKTKAKYQELIRVYKKDIISKLKQKHHEITQVYHDLSVFSKRYEVATTMAKTEHTFYAEGYVPVKEHKRLQKLAKQSHTHIEIDTPQDPPVLLRNNWYTNKFSFLTKMFGLPKYGFIEPTAILSLFVPFFFGFMFSDIGYGFLVMIMGIVLLSIAKKHQKIISDAGFVLVICSISTIIFGALFGSFFGNLIPITPLWFDPFVNAKQLLIIALGIGIIHLNLGFVLNFIESVKRRDMKSIIFTFVATILIEAGAISFFFDQLLGYLLIGASMALFVMHKSVMGIMNITELIGAWFSYSRLLALALATGGIALGVNIIAKEVQSVGGIGLVIGALILIVGHTFNFLLNILGSSIHSVRLHFIELFSQFYDASGKPYEKYTTQEVIDTL